jgi:hypothetical protein
VRIELDSTTSDVISLWARPIGRKRLRIAYTLVDEYDTEYGIRPARTARPLTLGQLIKLLDDVDTNPVPYRTSPASAPSFILNYQSTTNDYSIVGHRPIAERTKK